MNPSDQRNRHEEDDRATPVAAYTSNQGHVGSGHEVPGNNLRFSSAASILHLTARSSSSSTRQGPTRVHVACSRLSGRLVSFALHCLPRNNGLLYILPLGSGKTSFLRLLLDTSAISPNATREQLTSVAKFVQGCSGHTSHIRVASIDIDVDINPNGDQHRLGLTLIDTPSLNFKDEVSAERSVSDTLRHIDARFADGIENVSACTAALLHVWC